MTDPSHTPLGPCSPRTPPGPRGYPLLGILLELWQNPLKAFMEAAREYGDVVLLPVGPRRVYLLNRPDYIEHVLQENYRNYRLTPFYEKLKPVFGEGLLTSEGDLWRHQRQLMQLGFQRERLERLSGIMTTVSATMLERWQDSMVQGKPVDVAQEMARLTIEIVVRSLFSVDLSERAEEFGQAATFLLETTVRRTIPFADLTERMPTPRNRRFRRARQTMEEIVSQVIDARRREGGESRDLFSLLLETGNREIATETTETHLRDQVKTMVVSGYLTTANALTWIFYLLSQHLGVERRLRAEISGVLGGRTPSVADLSRLTYTKMVIQETLRLWRSPPTRLKITPASGTLGR